MRMKALFSDEAIMDAARPLYSNEYSGKYSGDEPVLPAAIQNHLRLVDTERGYQRYCRVPAADQMAAIILINDRSI
jgi:hypothetical protein